MYRETPIGKNRGPGKLYKQMIVPGKYSGDLMLLAHNCLFAGHFESERA